MRVLLVDDEAEVRKVVHRALEREDFDVIEAGDGEEALRRAAEAPIDIAVLDLNLPGMSGLEVLSALRQHRPGLHVVMLTGAGSEADRVLGLVSGADDYMVKPFSARELTARLVAVRRRQTAARPVVVEVGDIRVDMTAREATVGSGRVELTRREFDLFSYLVAHPRRTFTRGELLEAVWGSSADWQSAKTVTEHIRRLRSKVEDDPAHPVRIVSVPGAGYRFDPEGEPPPEVGPLRPDEATSGDATVVVVGTTIVYASPNTLELMRAVGPEDVVGRDILDFVAPESVAAVRARQDRARLGQSPRPEVIKIVRLDGDELLIELATVPVLWDDEPATQVTMWDVTADNSRMQELAIGIRSDVAEAIVIVDAQLRIQSFNPAAEQLFGWREEDVVGRTAREVMPWLGDDSTAGDIRDAFATKGRWHGIVVQQRRDGTPVTVRASTTLLRDSTGEPVGVVSVNRPIDVESANTVDVAPAEDALEDEIRRGIQRGEFAVHYQPIVDLETAKWTGVEALVRWEHPERGLLAPSAFIDAAERSGTIVQLGEFVFGEACRQVAEWQRAGHELHVSVNLSTRQLAAPDLFERLVASLGRSSLPPERLWLEITETALVHDLDQAAGLLHRLADLGVCVSIDDFGTGWSSLTYLREFPIGSLKIDRVFVAGLGTDSADTAIVTSILSLGRELDLFVVAEGIETERQRAELVGLGCVLGQGYLFGKPQAAELLGLGDAG